MPAPTPEQQIQFLTNLQRLLANGQFVSTYKYALLLALADLSIEMGDDSGEEMEVGTLKLGEKFVEYYWRQTAPFVQSGQEHEPGILVQNTGPQAAVVTLVEKVRQKHAGSLWLATRTPEWKPLINQVAKIVEVMPLWKLQTVGRQKLDFLYENVGKGKTVKLKPGVAFCFRKFYQLIGDIVRGAWVRYVRRFNHYLLGTTEDLTEFLFGSKRGGIQDALPILEEVQEGACFYCGKPLRAGAIHIDHFIPWSRYPLDLGHNFVLADRACNSKKSDHLAGLEHLARWIERNETRRDMLTQGFDERGILHDLLKTQQIVHWAYEHARSAGGLAWIRGEEFEQFEVR